MKPIILLVCLQSMGCIPFLVTSTLERHSERKHEERMREIEYRHQEKMQELRQRDQTLVRTFPEN